MRLFMLPKAFPDSIRRCPRGACEVAAAQAGTAHVAHNIADVNRGASETGSASAQVHASASELAGEGNKLKAEVDKFLATVRAA
jgi:methyl-accepting chemotaxis protein